MFFLQVMFNICLGYPAVFVVVNPQDDRVYYKYLDKRVYTDYRVYGHSIHLGSSRDNHLGEVGYRRQIQNRDEDRVEGTVVVGVEELGVSDLLSVSVSHDP